MINIKLIKDWNKNFTGCLVIFIMAFLVLFFGRFYEVARSACITTPVNVILVMDTSGSMAGTKFTDTKTSAKSFIDKLNLSAGGDSIGLVSFSDDATLQSSLTQDGAYVKAKVDGLVAGGLTYLDKGINKAHSNYTLPDKKIMIVLSDGAPTNKSAALLAASSAKGDNIRIITIGLDIGTGGETDTAEQIDAQNTLKLVATAPSDFYLQPDSSHLEIIYDTISESICDTTAPIISSISRNPAGTVYPGDKITIKSQANDDYGIKHNYIFWSINNWTTSNSSADSNCDASLNNCQLGNIGPFPAGTIFQYKVQAIDTNDNNVDSSIYSFTVATAVITSGDILRNTDNSIEADVSDPQSLLLSENAKYYLSVESPAGSANFRIDKTQMGCNMNLDGNTASCSYILNPDCSWDGANATVYLYPTDNYYIGFHNAAVKKTINLQNPSEIGLTLCNNGLDDNCNGLTDSADPACDTSIPIATIDEAKDKDGVYIPNGQVLLVTQIDQPSEKVNLSSTATDDKGVYVHKIEWSKDNWTTITTIDCGSNSSCTGQISGSLGGGTVVKYRSYAVDSNNNTGYSNEYSFTVVNNDCFGKSDLTSCSGGKCCGQVCDTTKTCSFDASCSFNKCSGTSWECEADISKNGSSCGSGEVCNIWNTTGCEIRSYACNNGACNYTASGQNSDSCVGINYNDYGCGNNCGAPTVKNCSSSNGSTNGTNCVCGCGGYGIKERKYSAAGFSGTNSYIEVPNSASLDFGSGNFTVDFWIKSTKDNIWTALGKNTSWFGTGAGWHFSAANSAADLYFEVANGTSRWPIRTYLGRTFNWAHVAGVRDGNTIKLYVNGKQKSSTTVSGSVTNTVPLRFGSTGGTGYFLGGEIDEVHMYKRALSSTEIDQHFNGQYLNESGLVGVWHLNETIGTTARDDSGKKNNGTLKNGVVWTSDNTCSDSLDNDCDSKLDSEEIVCDDNLDILTVYHSPSTVYDDTLSITLNSTASDTYGIQQHNVAWTKDDWVTSTVSSAGNCSVEDDTSTCTMTITGPLPAGTIVKYKAGALDVNGNYKLADGSFTVLSHDCIDKLNGTPCNGGSSCYSWPINGYGCETRNYACMGGACLYASMDQKNDICEGVIYKNFGCGNSCGAPLTVDCTTAGTINGTSCACNCGGYGTQEKFYGALDFDGADDYVNAGNNASLNFLDAMGGITVEAWVYPTNYTGHSSDQWYVVTKLNYPNKGWWLHLKNGGKVTFITCDGTCHSAVTSTAIPLNTWSHIVGWSNGLRTKVFVDGVEKASVYSGTLTDASSGDLFIGGVGSSDYAFKGKMDDVRIYNRALTAGEISSHFKGEYLNDGDLAGLWHMDEKTGASTADSSGNNNTGILKNDLGWLDSKTDSSVVAPPWQTICADNIDNDCNGNKDSAAETTCDNVLPTINITRTPNGNVLDTDTVTLISDASDTFGIQTNKILWSKDGGETFTGPTCTTNSCSVDIGPFLSATVIKYKAIAIDNNGNTFTTEEDEFVVHDPCFGLADGSSCSAGGGTCCGGFCDATHYRKPITISGSSSGPVTDYQIFLKNIPYDARMKPDFNDVYFTDSNGVDVLPFWKEKHASGVYADFWVKVPSIPQAPDTKVIYMYYGSPVVTSLSDGNSTFEFFDDFSAPSLDTNKWTVLQGQWVSQNQRLEHAGGNSNRLDAVRSKNYQTNTAHSIIIEGKVYWDSGSYFESAISWYAPNASTYYGSMLSKYDNTHRLSESGVSLQIRSYTPSNDIWYEFSNIIDGNSFKSKLLNDEGEISTTDPTYTSGYLMLNVYSPVTEVTYYDDIRVRKYISPEPTVSIGSEESKGLTDGLLDAECSQMACSTEIPSVWTWAAINDGLPCSTSSNGCYAWGNGCEVRDYSCSEGLCASVPSNQNIDSCSGTNFNDFGCNVNNCSVGQTYNCSSVVNIFDPAPAIADNSAVDCACKCGGFDIEEKLYNSLKFDGVDDYINVVNEQKFDFDRISSFTLEGWINPSLMKLQDIISKYNSTIYKGYLLELNAAGNLRFLLSGDGDANRIDVVTNNTIPIKTWSHIAITYDGSSDASGVNLYINGILQPKTITLDSLTMTILNNNDVRIGMLQDLARYFDGSIDEFRIYSRALSSSEVNQHYRGNYIDDAGLTGLWHFDEVSGNIASDGTINNNIGTLIDSNAGNADGSTLPKWMRGGGSSNAFNVAPSWQVCSDKNADTTDKDNDCNSVANDAEINCDSTPPIISVEAVDKNYTVIPDNGEVYDTNIDSSGEHIKIESIATDALGILSNKIKYKIGVAEYTTVECTGADASTCVVQLSGPIAANTVVKYNVIAIDNNYNTNCFPSDCVSDYTFKVIYSNNPPVVTPVSIGQAIDYCRQGPAITVKWQYFDADGDIQDKFNLEIDDSPIFSPPIVYKSGIQSSSSNTYTISSGLSYNTKYYWRIKVWDDRGVVSNDGDWISDGSFSETPQYEYPSAGFGWSPLTPKIGDAINFNDASVAEDGHSIVSRKWNFETTPYCTISDCFVSSPTITIPDNSSCEGNTCTCADDSCKEVSHTYLSAQDYIVSLIVDDGQYSCQVQCCVSVSKKKPKWKEIVPSN